MKRRLTFLLLGVTVAGSTAIVGASRVHAQAVQSSSSEAHIRSLEQLEVKAVLAKDRSTLRTLWDEAYVVNNPYNVIVEAKSEVTDRPVMDMARISMTRTTEKVTLRGDVAIAMGAETIVPGEGQARAGQTVSRRYTNIWMKQPDGWKLVARHANVVCR